MTCKIIIGDCRETLKTLADESVQCCVTSPPYFGLRDYGDDGQIGLEANPADYVAEIVSVFSEVWRVLRNDGTLWLNLGDSYANDGKWGGHTGGKHVKALHCSPIGRNKRYTGLKPKDLVGIPWRVAFALQAAGWYLRSDIIWHKPNPMPESVTDRPTKSHEYLFLLTKSERYYYDAEAIKEPAVSDHDSGNGFSGRQGGAPHMPMTGGEGSTEQWRCGRGGKNAFRGQGSNREDPNGAANLDMRDMRDIGTGPTRNRRTVWTVATQPFRGAHFATFPPDLVKPCIMAGSKPGDTILDPFGGSGTTGMVGLELGRNAILCELNPEYGKLAEQRTNITPGMAL